MMWPDLMSTSIKSIAQLVHGSIGAFASECMNLHILLDLSFDAPVVHSIISFKYSIVSVPMENLPFLQVYEYFMRSEFQRPCRF